MTSSQTALSRWPNPNVAASASENGPRGVMVNEQDTAPPVIVCPGGSLPRGSDSSAAPGKPEAPRMNRQAAGNATVGLTKEPDEWAYGTGSCEAGPRAEAACTAGSSPAGDRTRRP